MKKASIFFKSGRQLIIYSLLPGNVEEIFDCVEDDTIYVNRYRGVLFSGKEVEYLMIENEDENLEEDECEDEYEDE